MQLPVEIWPGTWELVGRAEGGTPEPFVSFQPRLNHI